MNDIPCIEVRGVTKTFQEDGRRVQALENVSFAARSGEFITIIGPSGSGKSTLFNLITGLADPEQGEILIDGKASADRAGGLYAAARSAAALANGAQ